jgi:hypothetical protein
VLSAQAAEQHAGADIEIEIATSIVRRRAMATCGSAFMTERFDMRHGQQILSDTQSV